MKNVLSIQSHVVYGCAGNSAAVFPMQRMGIKVFPLNTVQFSNHTQYKQGWKGMVMPQGQIDDLVEGLLNIKVLKECNAILSGYLGSGEQGREVISSVTKIKELNPSAVYLCDPVMGHPEKGCFVPPEVSEFYKTIAVKNSDYMTPNLLELETLTGSKISNIEEAVKASCALLKVGVKAVLVKHLGKAGRNSEAFEMLLTTNQGSTPPVVPPPIDHHT